MVRIPARPGWGDAAGEHHGWCVYPRDPDGEMPRVTRRYARELALQTLYSIEVGKHDAAAALAQTFSFADDPGHRAFVRDLVLGTLDHAAESDAIVAPLLTGWTIERLPLMDRLVLRMSVYELRREPQTPPAVVINEAVELAKKYSTEDSGRFINGVLASAARRDAGASARG